MKNPKADILNIYYEILTNQLWFANKNTFEVPNKFKKDIENIDELKKKSK